MKTQALFICFVLAFANAAELNPYMENTEDIFAEIKESSFGKGMLSLLKVHTTMGNNQQAILNLLDDIKTHIESERDFDVLNWTAQKALMEQIIQDYETQETTNQALVTSQTQKIVDDKAALVISDKGVTDETAEVKRLGVEITRAQALITTETTAFNTRQSRDSQAIAACNAALDLLRGFCDEADTTTTAGTSTFLQVNALVDVTNTFKSLGDVKYLPLINALTMLAQTGDVATVNEVVVLITELRDQIKGAYDQDAGTFPVNLAAWQQTETDLTAQQVSAQGRLTAYEATSATLTVTIADTEASLIVVTGLYDDAVEQLAIKRPELATAIANFANRQALRTQQLAILAKIRNLFVQDTANFIQLN